MLQQFELWEAQALALSKGLESRLSLAIAPELLASAWAAPLGELAAVIASGSPSASVSLPSTGMVTGSSSSAVAVSFAATGTSFTELTVTVTVEVEKPPCPSLMV